MIEYITNGVLFGVDQSERLGIEIDLTPDDFDALFVVHCQEGGVDAQH